MTPGPYAKSMGWDKKPEPDNTSTLSNGFRAAAYKMAVWIRANWVDGINGRCRYCHECISTAIGGKIECDHTLDCVKLDSDKVLGPEGKGN